MLNPTGAGKVAGWSILRQQCERLGQQHTATPVFDAPLHIPICKQKEARIPQFNDYLG